MKDLSLARELEKQPVESVSMLAQVMHWNYIDYSAITKQISDMQDAEIAALREENKCLKKALKESGYYDNC